MAIKPFTFKGTPGASAFVYVAYASNDQGADFSLTVPNDYIAVLSTTVAIPAPEASDFAGLWKLVKGEDGDAGICDLTTPAADVTGTGIPITLTANESHVFGDVCRINATGKAQKALADALINAGAIAICIETIAEGADGEYLVYGVLRKDAWNWTPGGMMFLAVAGGLTQTAPSGTDEVVQVLGIATHADRILFKPELVMVEHA